MKTDHLNMKILFKNNIDYVMICLISLALFLYLYGFRVLDVTNDNFLMTGGDLSQHYLGWKLFRNSKWFLQGGLMNTGSYPFQTSIIFTDSIPICAVFFKMIRCVLPETFQYFGIWGLSCFLLQGIIAIRLLRPFLKNTYIRIGTSALFLLMPCFLYRMFWHSALAAHWLILLAMCYFEEADEEESLKTAMIRWGMLGILCSSIHLYFLPMCGMMLLGTCIKKGLQRKWFQSFCCIGVFLVSSVIALWFLGAFSSGMDGGAPGFGYYSFNLNSFLNPLEKWSTFLPQLSLYTDGQYEGLAYLGIGSLLIILSGLLSWIFVGKKKWTIDGVAFFVIAFLLIVIAQSNVVAFGKYLLFQYKIPVWCEKLVAPFRSSGRLIWPVCYILLFCASVQFKKIKRKQAVRLTVFMIFFAVLLQIGDFSAALYQIHSKFQNQEVYENSLEGEKSVFHKLQLENNWSHLIFLNKNGLSQEDLYAFTDFATSHNMTINDFYFARNLNYKTNAVALDFLMHPFEEDVFVCTLDDAFLTLDNQLHWYRDDSFLYGTMNKVSDIEEITIEDRNSKQYCFLTDYIQDGTMNGNSCILYPGGYLFGPFWNLGSGEYQIEITGTGLYSLSIESYETGGDTVIPYSEILHTDKKIILAFQTTEDLKEYETKLTNLGSDHVQIDCYIMNRCK